ncbi:MAG: hypothetical protein RL114_1237 [Actinomycetota bacterium]|jgi:hypothetical protein
MLKVEINGTTSLKFIYPRVRLWFMKLKHDGDDGELWLAR